MKERWGAGGGGGIKLTPPPTEMLTPRWKLTIEIIEEGVKIHLKLAIKTQKLLPP